LRKQRMPVVIRENS